LGKKAYVAVSGAFSFAPGYVEAEGARLHHVEQAPIELLDESVLIGLPRLDKADRNALRSFHLVQNSPVTSFLRAGHFLL
jgi:hypothetical protein